jgi:hypothetical protein
LQAGLFATEYACVAGVLTHRQKGIRREDKKNGRTLAKSSGPVPELGS